MVHGDGRGGPDGPALRRRRFLGALGTAGSVVLAGCSTGSGSGTPTDGASGPALTTHMSAVPEDFNWTKADFRGAWPQTISPLAFDSLAMERGDGSVVGLLAEEWDHDDATIRIRLAESGWSDGSPVLGADVGMALLLDRYATGRSPGAVTDAGDPRSVLEATTDVTWDGREVVLHSDPGFYADFYVEHWLRQRLTDTGDGTVVSHRDELRPLLDDVEALDDPYSEAGREAVAEIRAPPTSSGGDPLVADPTDVIVSGPFAVDRVFSGRVELRKNPHFRRADDIHFDAVTVLALVQPRPRWDAIQSNTLDAVAGLFETPPPKVIDSFPDNIEYHRWGTGTLNGVVVNQFYDEWLGDARVRQAIAYALDKPRLASVQHEYAARAPTDPPGLTYRGHERWVDADLQSSFQTYERDLDRATALLRDAGFTRPSEDATWRTPTGERWSLDLLTSSETVQLELNAVANLRDLGADAELNRYTDAKTNSRIALGNFQLAAHSWAGAPDGLYREALLSSEPRSLFGLWSHDAVEEWVAEHDNLTVRDYTWTERVEGFEPAQTKRFTLPAPPVGEPDSDERVDYPVAYMDLRLDRGLDEATRRRYKQVLAWVFNWHLPLVPYTQSFNLAFQDHGDWDAPTDPAAWDTYAPTFHLVSEGRIEPAD